MSTLQFKRGTAARWVELNPTLAAGEPGFEYDTKKFKIGDGDTPWTELSYTNESIVVTATKDELPTVGNEQCLYRVSNEKILYQWNQSEQKYESLSQGSGFDPSEIKTINGGTANG